MVLLLFRKLWIQEPGFVEFKFGTLFCEFQLIFVTFDKGLKSHPPVLLR